MSNINVYAMFECLYLCEKPPWYVIHATLSHFVFTQMLFNSTIHKAASLRVPGRSIMLPGTIPETPIRHELELLARTSGGSRISPRRGRQLPRGAPTYDFAKFGQKTA